MTCRCFLKTRRSWKAKIRFVGWLQGSEFLMTFFAMSLKLPCLGIDGVFGSPELILDGYISFLENDWKLLWTCPFSGWFRIHLFFYTRNPPKTSFLKPSKHAINSPISRGWERFQKRNLCNKLGPSSKIGFQKKRSQNWYLWWLTEKIRPIEIVMLWYFYSLQGIDMLLVPFFFQDLLGRSVSNRWGEDRYLTKPPSWWCLRSVSSSLWLEQIYGCGAWSEC